MLPQRRNHLSALFLIAFMAMTATGCYTLLKHPEIASEPDTYDMDDASCWYGCTECHGVPVVGPIFPPPWPPPPPDLAQVWWQKEQPPERDIINRDKIFRREPGDPIVVAPPDDPPGIIPVRPPVENRPPDLDRKGKEAPPEEKHDRDRVSDWRKERDQRNREAEERRSARENERLKERNSRDSGERKRDQHSESNGANKKNSDEKKDSNTKSERKKDGK